MEIALSVMKAGASGVVKSIKCEADVKRRLCDMGIIPGTRVIVSGRAPFGGPLTVYIRGYYLCIGILEARSIFLE